MGQRARARAAATAKQASSHPHRTLSCPNCRRALRRRDVLGVEVDECPSCKTAWFDEGELDIVLRGRAGVGVGTLGPSAAADQTHGRCPVCPRSTTSFRFHAAPAARVQACPGHGQWVEQSDGRTMIRWASRESFKVRESFKGRYLRRIAKMLEGWTHAPEPLILFGAWCVTRDPVAAVGLTVLLGWAAQRWAQWRTRRAAAAESSASGRLSA